jgi:lysophospholipid acyltransferase (LPLAT)-like uncharacterized protein
MDMGDQHPDILTALVEQFGLKRIRGS